MGVVSIFLAVTLGYFTAFPPSPQLGPLFLGITVTTMVLFPFVRRAITKSMIKAVDVEALERSYDLLDQKRDNISAYIRIARSLYERGLAGHAIGIMDNALSAVQNLPFDYERGELRAWKAQTKNPKYFKPLTCFHCGHKNSPGIVFCESCGWRYLVDHVRGSWGGGELARKLIGGWSVAVILLFAIPLSASMLPPIPAVVLIVFELALGAFVAFRTFFGGLGSSQA
jgi:hypothetical protein